MKVGDKTFLIGAETAKELGFQYIVTMNEDYAFKEKEEGFDLNDYVLSIKLTDVTKRTGLVFSLVNIF